MNFFLRNPNSNNVNLNNINEKPKIIDEETIGQKKNITTPDQESWSFELVRDFFALFSSILFSALGYGILVPLIAFKLESNLSNSILISISSITQIGAGIIFAKILPEMGKKYGLINSLYIGTILSASSALLLYFYIDYFLWLVSIFIFGTSLFICGVIRQTIILEASLKKSKALMISSGSMIVAIGNSLGPIILSVIQTNNSFASYFLAFISFLISMLPLSKLQRFDNFKIREEKKIGILRYIKNSPKIMLAGFTVNYAISSSNAFLIIYGIKLGLAQDEAALLYSVLLFGTIFSLPIGYLTDVINKRFLMIFSAIISLACISLILFTKDIHNLYLLLFASFGAMTGMKLPALVLINDKYKPTQRLAVNSAFSKFSLMGNISGVIVTGSIIQIFGPKGLWISIIAILLFFIIFCVHNYSKKIINKNQSDELYSLDDISA